MECYGCEKEGTHELRELPMCDTHYIEALEHGADLSFDICGLAGVTPFTVVVNRTVRAPSCAHVDGTA